MSSKLVQTAPTVRIQARVQGRAFIFCKAVNVFDRYVQQLLHSPQRPDFKPDHVYQVTIELRELEWQERDDE